MNLALFGAFCVHAGVDSDEVSNPWTSTCLLVGAMLPYRFTAITMKSVGRAANAMLQECKRQVRRVP